MVKTQNIYLPFKTLIVKVADFQYADWRSTCLICATARTYCISYPEKEFERIFEQLGYSIFMEDSAVRRGLIQKSKKKFICSGKCINKVVENHWNTFVSEYTVTGITEMFGDYNVFG